MIRIIIRTDDAGMAANIGGNVDTKYRTFDISAPEIEAFMREKLDSYSHRHFVGVELVAVTS